MIPGIRLRIGLMVLAAVGVCQILLSLYVLDRIAKAQRVEVDQLLADDVDEVAALLGSDQLLEFVRHDFAYTSKWTEEFLEIREVDGALIAASSNLPPEGLGPAVDATTSAGISFWERTHPTSRRGHVRIRVADATYGDVSVRVAHSLKRHQRTYWMLRRQLVLGFLAVATLGGVGAWWVSTRSLSPIRRIAARASRLGATSHGLLPRTGAGDELDQLVDVLNDLLLRVRSDVERVRRMTADAGHALRTPLSVVRAALEDRLRHASAADASSLEPVLESIDDAVRLANRLIHLERIESGALANNRTIERVSLDAVARHVADVFRVVAEDRGVSLVLRTRPADLRGVPEQLREAIGNLLDNALRHTPPGGTMELEVYPSGERAHLVVSDTGPGLRSDQLERVFERFYSESGVGAGTGLGLAIARAIARAHGGDLVASSPRGARFDMDLPLAQTDGPATR